MRKLGKKLLVTVTGLPQAMAAKKHKKAGYRKGKEESMDSKGSFKACPNSPDKYVNLGPCPTNPKPSWPKRVRRYLFISMLRSSKRSPKESRLKPK